MCFYSREERGMKKILFLLMFFFLFSYVAVNKFTLGIIVFIVYIGFALLALKKKIHWILL